MGTVTKLAVAIAVGTATLVSAALVSAPGAAAAPAQFCAELGANWDGQYCRTSVTSERQAVRDIKVAIPGELIDDPAAGPVVRNYLTTLVDNWRRANTMMAADSFGEGNYQIFRRGNTVSLVYHETYHADGPDFNNAYRTFTFADGRQLALADLFSPGTDPFVEIPARGHPYIVAALDQAPPPHHPGTYPFVADRWTPNNLYSGGYKAWALTPDELILYMPDYPVGRDSPIDFNPQIMQWSMDGGTVQARIPLAALQPVLRPEFGG